MNVVRVTPNEGTSTVPGPVLFARYAFPPNSHGYCGPGDHESFFSYGVAGADDRGLRELARQFAGAWPYLELIAAATARSAAAAQSFTSWPISVVLSACGTA